MMGKDCEEILSSIGALIDALTDAIIHVSVRSSYRITVYNGIEEKDGCSVPKESISAAIMRLRKSGNKLMELGKGLFVDTKGYNNSYGSPWGEMKVLYNFISEITSYLSRYPDGLDCMGQRLTILTLMNTALTLAIDAKHALILNHDNIQQGFDKEFNNNTPSMTKKVGVDTYSIGHVKQDFDENVCCKSPDPYESPF